MKYVYPAIFIKEKKGYSVSFPDFDECYTCGDDLKDAIYMAQDALAFTLFDYEKEHKNIPEPSITENIKLAKGEFINFIVCDTIEYQKRNNNKAVKKTLSIPQWLNEAGVSAGLNFSQLLQDAIKKQLNL